MLVWPTAFLLGFSLVSADYVVTLGAATASVVVTIRSRTSILRRVFTGICFFWGLLFLSGVVDLTTVAVALRIVLERHGIEFDGQLGARLVMIVVSPLAVVISIGLLQTWTWAFYDQRQARESVLRPEESRLGDKHF